MNVSISYTVHHCLIARFDIIAACILRLRVHRNDIPRVKGILATK